MKTEFIYSIGEIFGSVLSQAGLNQYYIGPYQRGYKWNSDNYYDEVPQLLIDVYEAMKNKTEEYYLQYITVLKNNDLNSYEVIDGQQRLTTLAIIYDRLSRADSNFKSLATGSIEYAREENSYTLFDKILGVDSTGSPLPDTQDLHYIRAAASCIDCFIDKLIEAGELGQYHNFLTNNVKIILNRESDFVSPEDVFVNLNGNNVALTNSYLIKGLLLTKSICRTDKNGLQHDYNNIVEQRRVNSRLWDEIQNWVKQPAVTYFFFGKEASESDSGMERILEMILELENGGAVAAAGRMPVLEKFRKDFDATSAGNDSQSGYRLFNKFNEVVVSEADGIRYMKRLVHVYKKLRTMYERHATFNLLGYVLFTIDEHSRNELLRQLIDKSNREIQCMLATEALKELPDLSIKEPRYNDKGLKPLLLSFSVFPETAPSFYRFDFVMFDRKKWTYEHIRPQNPKDSDLKIPEYCRQQLIKLVDTYRRDRELEARQVPGEQREANNFDYEELKNQINNLLIEQDVDQLTFLYSDLDEDLLHSMGNMALLTGGANSSLSNNPFIIKRGAALKMAEDGVFIPPHTLSVFSKMLNMQKSGDDKQFSPELLQWDATDVQAHAEWMRQRNKEIIKYLTELKK